MKKALIAPFLLPVRLALGVVAHTGVGDSPALRWLYLTVSPRYPST